MSLQEEVGRSFSAQGKTLALAESITGGLVSSMLTDVPGASKFFLVGLVVYSNESKKGLLGVREATLRSHGAVSHECALEMARGAREAVGADIGAACTGIAGPGGGTASKPVGLVYIAVDDGRRALVEEERFQGGRSAVKHATAKRMLELILLELEP